MYLLDYIYFINAYVVGIASRDPVFDISRRHFMSREEALVNAAKRSMTFVKCMNKMNIAPESLKGRSLMLYACIVNYTINPFLE